MSFEDCLLLQQNPPGLMGAQDGSAACHLHGSAARRKKVFLSVRWETPALSSADFSLGSSLGLKPWPSSEEILFRSECSLKATLSAERDFFDNKEPDISLNWRHFTFHCPIFLLPVPTVSPKVWSVRLAQDPSMPSRMTSPIPGGLVLHQQRALRTSDTPRAPGGLSVCPGTPLEAGAWWRQDQCVCGMHACVLKHGCPRVALLLPRH